MYFCTYRRLININRDMCCNIKIKHVFLCINICCTPGWCWNPGLKGEGLNDPEGLIKSENLVWSLLLYKVILSLENFWKTLRIVHFVLLSWRAKSWKIRRFWKRLFQSKDVRHPNVTKLLLFLCTLLLTTSIFVTL